MARWRETAARLGGTTIGRCGPVGAQVAAKLVGDGPVPAGVADAPVGVTRRGIRLCLDIGDTVQRHIYMTGTYDEPSVRLLEMNLRAGDVVLDVGANIGWFSLRLGRRLRRLGAGTVHAFEPAPDTLARLAHHVDVNRLSDFIEVHAVALADRDGTLVLKANEDFGGPDVGTRTLFGSGPKVAEVSVRRGVDFLAARGVPRADVVKIDVEGSEWLVLQGLAPLLSGTDPPRLLVVELLDRHLERAGSSPREVIEFLADHGYRGEKVSADLLGLRASLRRTPKALAHNVVFRRASRSRAGARA